MMSRGPRQSEPKKSCLCNCRGPSRGRIQLWTAVWRAAFRRRPPDTGLSCGWAKTQPQTGGPRNQERLSCISEGRRLGLIPGPPGPLRGWQQLPPRRDHTEGCRDLIYKLETDLVLTGSLGWLSPLLHSPQDQMTSTQSGQILVPAAGKYFQRLPAVTGGLF